MGFNRLSTEHPSEATVSLRFFRPDDLEVLYQIDQECFEPGVSYSHEELAAFIVHQDSKTWVATVGKEIVGFLIANRRPRPGGHVITVDVVERWRRCGVATQLMNAAEGWGRLQKLQFIRLETAEDNSAALAFYEKRGYVKVRRVPRYYSNGAAAWVMVKALEQLKT